MLHQFLFELISSFIFIYILLTFNDPITTGITLITLMYFTKKFFNGAFNPAGTIAQYLNGYLDNSMFLYMILAQILGAIIACYFYKMNRED